MCGFAELTVVYLCVTPELRRARAWKHAQPTEGFPNSRPCGTAAAVRRARAGVGLRR